MVTAFAGTSPAAEPIHKVAPPPRAGEISLAAVRDIDAGDGSCRLSTALRALPAANVHDCGFYDPAKIRDRDRFAKQTAVIDCATEALAAHRPFIATWHIAGGDPLCDDAAMVRGLPTVCGSATSSQTFALVGLNDHGSYATYFVEAAREHVKSITTPGVPARLHDTATSTTQHCASVVTQPSLACDNDYLQHCLFCDPGDPPIPPKECRVER
jgi:hypothetical protein